MEQARVRTASDFEWRPEAAHFEGSGLIFVGYLLLIVIEYLGLQQDVPILKMVRFSTILSYTLVLLVAIRAPKLDLFERIQTKLILAFIVLTMMSIAWAVVKMRAFDSIRPLVDYFCFMFITIYVIDRQSRVKWLCATMAFVASVLVFRNLEQLGDASRTMHFSASYFMGDGNDFSWGMNMMLPIALFLAISKQPPLLFRLVGVGGTMFCLMGIIGTSSRGGSLGLIAAGLFGWLFVAKRRALGMVAVVVGVCLIAFLAPSGYFTRMQTVTPTGIDEDNSAQIRLQAWGAAVTMALDYPLGVGAGNFGSAYGRFYRPTEGGRISYGANRWVAAHSIYFKVIGEYGFPGVVMLLWLIGSNLAANFASRRQLRQLPAGAPLDDLWPGLLNMSMIATAVCGVFLGGFNYPHLFLLSGLVISTSRIVECSRVEVTLKAVTAAPIARALSPTERPSRSPVGRLPARPVSAATTGHSYFD